MKKASSNSTKFSPLFFVLAAAVLWSTGGLFIKWTSLSGLELSFGRSLLAAITVAIFTRHEGFGLNRVTAAASVLYAALLLLFVLATKETTAANAIFLQYTAPVYLLILEPLIYKEKFRRRDLIVVVACVIGMSLVFCRQAAAAGRHRESAGARFRTLLRVLFPFAATFKVARGESRVVCDLRESSGGVDYRACWVASHRRVEPLRCFCCFLSGRGPNWCGLHAVYRSDGPRGSFARCRHRRLHRTDTKSNLGIPGAW